MIEDKIKEVFDDTVRTVAQQAPPALERDMILLETGLDSLGFAVLVTRLVRTALTASSSPFARKPGQTPWSTILVHYHRLVWSVDQGHIGPGPEAIGINAYRV